MIDINKVYIINVNNPTEVECFSIKEQTAEAIATYFLGRRVYLHLLCCPNYRSIFLKSRLYTAIVKEIQQWLNKAE